VALIDQALNFSKACNWAGSAFAGFNGVTAVGHCVSVSSYNFLWHALDSKARRIERKVQRRNDGDR
jgi:hypothetical protein